MARTSSPLGRLYQSLKTGEISRRDFIEKAGATGAGAGASLFLANAAGASGSRNGVAMYPGQDGTPSASPAEGGAVRPDAGTEGQARGEGGELRLIQWQAATQLSPHVSTGIKDFMAATPVLEPLMHYLPDATVIPNLVTEVPSVENGLLAEDLTEVTFTLLPDVVWSDGTPFTAEDVRFTVEWVKDPANNSVNQTSHGTIENVEVVDDLTARVIFTAPNPFWLAPFTGTSTGFIYPKHILEGGKEAHDAFLSAPIGTGPYVVESFSPNDQATYIANENYREANKPYFSTISLKGGGDPASAARAVIQTGEFHFAWYLQVENDVLVGMEADDNPGIVIPYPGATVERININFSDPNTEVDGQRSEMNTPHPFFTDDAVREAMATAIDRQLIKDSFYGDDMSVAVNIVQGDPATYSGNTSWEYNPEAAAQILEDAGWTMDGDVRVKDGVELRLRYATETNSLSQKTQAVVKANLDAIGFNVQLEQVEAGSFYDGAAGNDQNLSHFYTDLNMFKSVPSSPRPISFMETWYAGTDGSNIAQASNEWNGANIQRWVSPEYDALFEAAQVETDPDRLAELFIEMNDMLIMNHVIVPLIVVGTPRGMSKLLREENMALAPFSNDYWNIANWNFADGAEL